MEIRTGNPEPGQRRIALQCAAIQIDGAQLRRTAQFTDGTVRAVAMNWADVKRIAAFRRDVLTSAVVSVAVTDTANVVVLDEHMDGWAPLIEHLPVHVTLATSFAEWLNQAIAEPHSSHWAILFKA
jgi:hypothetical protein